MARWMLVIEAFTRQDAWGVRELAADLGLSPSVTHRILHDLERLGMASPAGAPGRFRVGPRLARASTLIAGRLDLVRLARPIIEAASASLGETVILAQYDPVRRRFWAVDAAESTHTIRYLWESLRDWSDLSLGASGRGILAFLDDAERDAIVDGLPDPLPGPTGLRKAALRASLDAARRDGYVISHGERYSGAVGVSAPIRDATGAVIGDLIGSWPDNRTDAAKEQRAARLIVEAADALSRELGHAGSGTVGATGR